MPKFIGPRSAAERNAELDRSRGIKMAASTHAYVRGNTRKFYEWLAESRTAAAIPAGPAVWICGDCHLGNLGPLADENGAIDVQIRDLDQTVIGNPAHDLIRLGLSLAAAARSADLPGVTTAHMLEEMVLGYSRALDDPGDTDAVAEPRDITTVRRRAMGRRWRHLAEERLEDVSPGIPLGRRFWSLLPEERAALDEVFTQGTARDLIVAMSHRDDEATIKLVDGAYWKKGCSSLGTLRFAALVRISGKRLNDQMALIDLKEAVKSVAPAAAGVVKTDAAAARGENGPGIASGAGKADASSEARPGAPAAKGANTASAASVPAMPSDHAVRVVTGARALSPNLGDRMAATRILGKPMVMRELMPQDLKLEIDQFSRAEAPRAARYLAHVVGLAHARQLDAAARRAWRGELQRRHSTTLDAPSWLWSSVVDLVGRHEEGYLDHCRRFAARLG